MRSAVIFCAVLLIAASGHGQVLPEASGADRLRRLPVTFEENRGQSATDVRFLTTAGARRVLFTDRETVFGGSHGRSSVRLRVLGGRPGAIEGLEATSGTSNYFIGASSNWRTGIPNYSRLRRKQVYEGIDLVFHGTPGDIEYDFIVSPGADPKRIEMEFAGARSVKLTRAGDLVVSVDGFEMVQHKPVMYQTAADGGVNKVRGRYSLRQNRISFVVDAYDRTRELVIDPVLTYAAVVGGSLGENFADIAVDSTGNTYVTGNTRSTDFPATGLRQGNGLVFVYKLNPTGTTVLYSALIGGNGQLSSSSSSGIAIAVDNLGNAFVAGGTNDGDFPTTPGAFQAGFVQQSLTSHGFVLKLNASGTALIYSTYLRGNSGDDIFGIAVNGSGEAYLSGSTSSSDFPTTPGAFKTSLSTNYSVFVAKLNASGTGLVYSTFLSGNGAASPTYDYGRAIAIDGLGNAYVAGSTNSLDFPVTPGAFQSSTPALSQGAGFVTKLNPSGNTLVYSTYVTNVRLANGIAVDSAGNAVVVGKGIGPGLFALKLNTAGSAASYIQELGSNLDNATGVAVDSDGNAYVVGTAVSANLPLISPIQTLYGPGYVFKLDPSGALSYATYLGAPAYGIAIGPQQTAYVGGILSGAGFTTTPGAVTVSANASPPHTFVVALSTSTGCSFSLSPVAASFPFAGGQSTVDVIAPPGCNWIAFSNQTWITFTTSNSGSGNGTLGYSVQATSDADRSAPVSIAGLNFTVSQSGNCTYAVSPSSVSIPASGGLATTNLATSANCVWSVPTPPSWIALVSAGPPQGSAQLSFNVSANTTGSPRSATFTIAGQSFTVNQAAGATCSFLIGPTERSYTRTGNSEQIQVTTTSGCSWTAVSNVPWLTVASVVTGGSDPSMGIGSGYVDLRISPNAGAQSRTGTVAIAGQLFTATQAGLGNDSLSMRLVPVTPCRVADTRNPDGPFGGPALAASAIRDFTIPASACGIPANAAVYSLNITVVPLGPLGFISVWPTGGSQPAVSTLNSSDGRVKANAAIVVAGTNGAIRVFASNPTHVIIDINAYFIPNQPAQSLAFYPVNPCRIADTRSSPGTFGAPSLGPGQRRDFPIRASACSLPDSAQAYSLNMTVVPSGPLGFLSTWPAGSPQPGVSTLNAPTGTVTANAAIVPAGVNGAISVIATNTTDVIIDVNGYFAPPGQPGALSFYTVAPCRIMDSRDPAGVFGGPILPAAQIRDVPIWGSNCVIPGASAYSLNATVVPPAPLGFLSMWPTGSPQPGVSTLNASDGSITANAAIVPASLNGSISAFMSNASHLILDINGYFAP